jgi:hypothetical protein
MVALRRFSLDDSLEIFEPNTLEDVDVAVPEELCNHFGKFNASSSIRPSKRRKKSSDENCVLYTEERHLLNSFLMLKNVLTVGDYDTLDQMIHDIFSPSVTIFSSLMNSEEPGIDRVKQFFSALTAIPDLVLVLKTVKYNRSRGVMSALYNGSGSIQFNHDAN